MQYLGIDYGTKRIGIAVSDEDGILAFPRTVLANTPQVLDTIATLVSREGIGAIVIGESKDYRGVPNPIMGKIIPFAKRLEAVTGVTPVFHTEVLTSREAAHIQGDHAMNDASAAAIMLQSHLDRLNKRPSVDNIEHDG